MSMGKIARVGFVGTGTLGLGIAVFACFDPPEKNPHSGAPPPAGACVAASGAFPEPNCDSSDNECTQEGCQIAPRCGATDTCLPLSDNAGKSTVDLRMRRLTVISPAALAERTIQLTVVTKNVDLKAEDCGENGFGAFNWLLSVDRTNNTVKNGGAPPSEDAFTAGYCYYNHNTPGGNIPVAPVTANITFEGDTFTSEKIPKVNIPIFLNGDKNNVVVLPLTETTFQKVTLSAADNCIGQFNLAALEADGCGEDQSTCLKWKTNASLGGYITLEEADNVNVKDLGQSLCVLLTGTAAQKTAEGKCPRNPDNTITPRGDYCSTSKQAEDCKDSFWLSATFAASAVRIHDGASVPECVPQAP